MQALLGRCRAPAAHLFRGAAASPAAEALGYAPVASGAAPPLRPSSGRPRCQGPQHPLSSPVLPLLIPHSAPPSRLAPFTTSRRVNSEFPRQTALTPLSPSAPLGFDAASGLGEAVSATPAFGLQQLRW